MKKIILSIIALLFCLPSSAALLSPMDKALVAIWQHYIEPDMLDPAKLFNSATAEIENEVPEALIKPSSSSTTALVGLAEKSFLPPPASVSKLSQGLMPIVNFVEAHKEHFPDEPTALESALKGIAGSLDPHTDFLSRKAFKEFKVGTQGQFGGLGIVIGIKEDQITVISPVEGTPAWNAGIKSGDKLLEINDESTINMSLTEAVNRLRGEIGTKVRLVMQTAATGKSRELILTRSLITIDSIQKATYPMGGKNFAYIRVKGFQSNTMEDFDVAYDELTKSAAISGVILDLRDDAGGLLDQAVELADRFLRSGKIVSTIAARKRYIEESVAEDDSDDIDLPVIVIMNQGSASASEIVAGALKYNQRALALGQQTFGKGTVQTVFELGDGSALKLTIAQYLAAGTHPIQQVGVAPDIKLNPMIVDPEHFDLIEDEKPAEEKLEHTLTSFKKLDDSTLLKLFYLQSKAKDEEESYYTKTPKLADDYAVQIAAKILAGTKSAKAVDLKTSALKLFPTLQAQNDKAITDALQKQQINWTAIQPTVQKPDLRLKYRLYDKSGKIIKDAPAGEEVFVELEIENKSAEPISRVIAVAKEPEKVRGLEYEFVFGLIGAQEKVSRRVKVEFPASFPRQRLDLSLVIKSDQTEIMKNQKIPVFIDAAADPRFEFSYNIPPPIKGSKPISMEVKITNVGKGTTSDNSTAVLYNECEKAIFMESGRSPLKSIPPSGSATALFKFHLNVPEPPAQCFLRLAIADPKHMIINSQRIAITSAGAIPPAQKNFLPPVLSIPEAPLVTSKLAYDLKGSAADDEKLKDWIVYLGEEKIAYGRNPDGSNKMPIQVQIPLKIGRNLITIVARDQNDLSDNHQLVIIREE